jgi:hypothetical protein
MRGSPIDLVNGPTERVSEPGSRDDLEGTRASSANHGAAALDQRRIEAPERKAARRSAGTAYTMRPWLSASPP